MAEIQIAWLELMTVGGLGVILVLLGVTFNIIVKRQNQLCTKQTDGIVKQYGFPGNGRVYPIVEYFVNGTVFNCLPHSVFSCIMKIIFTTIITIKKRYRFLIRINF